MPNDRTPFMQQIEEVFGPPPAPKPHGYASVFLRVGKEEAEMEVELHGSFHESQSPTRSSPGQRGGWVLEEVKCSGTYLTPFLTDSQLRSLEETLNETTQPDRWGE